MRTAKIKERIEVNKKVSDFNFTKPINKAILHKTENVPQMMIFGVIFIFSPFIFYSEFKTSIRFLLFQSISNLLP